MTTKNTITYNNNLTAKKVAEHLVQIYRLKLLHIKELVKNDPHIDRSSIEMEVFHRKDKYYRDISSIYGLPDQIFTLGNKTGATLFGVSLTELEAKDIKKVEDLVKQNWNIIKEFDKTIKGREWLLDEDVIQITWLEGKNFKIHIGNSFLNYVDDSFYKYDPDDDEQVMDMFLSFGRDGIKICEDLSRTINDLNFHEWGVCQNWFVVKKENNGYRIQFEHGHTVEGPLSVFSGSGVYVNSYEEFKKGWRDEESLDN